MHTRRLAVFACAFVLARTPPVAAQADTAGSGPAQRPLFDASRARIAFGATGRTIPQGHGAIVAHYLFLPTLTLGVHDRVTLIAGTAVPIIIGGGPGELPYWVGGKVGIVQRPAVAVAIGGLHFRVDSSDPTSTIGYAVVTGELETLSLTVAVLRGFGGGFEGETGAMAGAVLRIDREWSALVEAWSFELWGTTPPAVIGLRWSNARAAFTAGASSWRAPYVDFAVQW